MRLQLENLVDRNLIAKRSLVARDYPAQDANAVFTINRGENVGAVWSWISKEQTIAIDPVIPLDDPYFLYFMFEDIDGTFYYVPYNRTFFDLEAINQQIIEENKTAWERWRDTLEGVEHKAGALGRNIRNIVFAFAAITIVPRFLKKK